MNNNNNFSDLISAINEIYPNINNITSHMNAFSQSCDEYELKKIDQELIEIKKILDANNINIKNLHCDLKDTLLNSMDSKLNYLKNSFIDKNLK